MNITDPRFRYVPSTKTNIAETFRKHGWIAPTEQEEMELRDLMSRIDAKKYSGVDLKDPVVRTLIELELVK